MSPFIQVVAMIVTGDTRPSFFVDLVTHDEGHASWSNLRVLDSAHAARKVARQLADSLRCTVHDKTLEVRS